MKRDPQQCYCPQCFVPPSNLGEWLYQNVVVVPVVDSMQRGDKVKVNARCECEATSKAVKQGFKPDPKFHVHIPCEKEGETCKVRDVHTYDVK